MPKITIRENKPETIQLFYRVFFDGKEQETINQTKTSMLVYHGGPGIVDHQMELDFFQQFANHDVQVIFVDHRGNGQSDDGDTKDWTIHQCGRDIKGLCDALDLKKPIVAGVSWGGYVVQSYAGDNPTHPGAIILFNTEAKVDFQARANAFRDSPGGEMAEEACHLDDTEPTQENDQAYLEKCAPYFSHKPVIFIPPHRTNLDMRLKYLQDEHGRFDLSDGMQQVDCPILQIAGTHDCVHPITQHTATFQPHASHEYYEVKAGTPAYNDATDATADHVTIFLAKHLNLDVSSDIPNCCCLP